MSGGKMFQIKLPLNTNELVPNVVDLDGGSCELLLCLKLYDCSFILKNLFNY